MSTCKHEITSVVSSQTIVRKVKGVDTTFLVQVLRCVDCGVNCETSIT